MDRRPDLRKLMPPPPRPPRGTPEGPSPPRPSVGNQGTGPQRPGSPSSSSPPRSVISVPRFSGETTEVEQAVFTSLRSLTGEGYRIIASSPGLRPNEKTEITRRCPSHGGLCEGAQVVGLLAFSLPGGRHCVCHVRPAGLEHTGRGGARIYTHAAIIDRATFQRFGADAVRVHAALAQVAGAHQPLEKCVTLGPLALPVLSEPAGRAPDTLVSVLGREGSAEEAGFAYLIAEVLKLQAVPWIMVGAAAPMALLDVVLTALPLAVRTRLALSVGITYARERRIDVALIEPDDGLTQRAIRGHSARWFEWPVPPEESTSGCLSWVRLVRRRLSTGLQAQLAQLTAALPTGTQGPALERVAQIANDMESFETARRFANAALLKELLIKYAGFSPANQAETLLLKPFWEATRPAEASP